MALYLRAIHGLPVKLRKKKYKNAMVKHQVKRGDIKLIYERLKKYGCTYRQVYSHVKGQTQSSKFSEMINAEMKKIRTARERAGWTNQKQTIFGLLAIVQHLPEPIREIALHLDSVFNAAKCGRAADDCDFKIHDVVQYDWTYDNLIQPFLEMGLIADTDIEEIEAGDNQDQVKVIVSVPEDQDRIHTTTIKLA